MWLRVLRRGQVPWGRLASRGEWSGQCPINKSAVQTTGPQASRGRADRLSSGSDKNGLRELSQGTDGPRPCSALVPPRGAHSSLGRARCLLEAETGTRRAWLSLAPSCREQLLGDVGADGRKLWSRCRCPISSTCPGPPGAAAPHSSGRSAGTSGSSPPLQSDTCGQHLSLRRPPSSRRGICPRGAGPGAAREAGWGDGPLPRQMLLRACPTVPHPQSRQCAERGGQKGAGRGRRPCVRACPAPQPGPYPSWMNSSRAAHSDTSCGRPLLSTTKDRMGSRSSAPLQDRACWPEALGACGLLNPQTAKPQLSPREVLVY